MLFVLCGGRGLEETELRRGGARRMDAGESGEAIGATARFTSSLHADLRRIGRRPKGFEEKLTRDGKWRLAEIAAILQQNRRKPKT